MERHRSGIAAAQLAGSSIIGFRSIYHHYGYVTGQITYGAYTHQPVFLRRLLAVFGIMLQHRLQLPPLTQHLDWARTAMKPWHSFLANPNDIPEKFYVWLFERAVARDVPTLYFVMTMVWSLISPSKSKGASRSVVLARLFSIIQLALSVARLIAARRLKKWPAWFKVVWRALPPSHIQGITTLSFSGFLSAASWLKGNGGVSSVYVVFSHSGLYVGKANVLRAAGQRPGIPERFIEHMVGLLFPRSRDGSLPRYKVLRQTLGSIGMLPLTVVASEPHALSLERALINTEKPNCNGADSTVFGTSKAELLGVRKAGRCRPPAPLRCKPLSSPSVWDHLHYKIEVQKQTSAVTIQKIPRLPYGKLYRWLQDNVLLTTGCIGPLALFGTVAIPLFIAFVATRNPFISFPSSWFLWQKTRQIYMSAAAIPSRFGSFGLQLAARSTLEKALCGLKMPPLAIRPWIVPSAVLARRGKLRSLAYSCIQKIQDYSAWRWIAEHLRVAPGTTKRWTDRVNAKIVLSKLSLTALRDCSVPDSRRLANMPSLRAHEAPWRLPVWPSQMSSALRRKVGVNGPKDSACIGECNVLALASCRTLHKF